MQLVPGHSCKARSPGNRTAGVTEDACLARGGRQVGGWGTSWWWHQFLQGSYYYAMPFITVKWWPRKALAKKEFGHREAWSKDIRKLHWLGMMWQETLYRSCMLEEYAKWCEVLLLCSIEAPSFDIDTVHVLSRLLSLMCLTTFKNFSHRNPNEIYCKFPIGSIHLRTANITSPCHQDEIAALEAQLGNASTYAAAGLKRRLQTLKAWRSGVAGH